MGSESAAGARSKRLTIGYLGSTIEDGIGRMLWSGIHELCQGNDIHLVSFTGNELNGPRAFTRQGNIIYDMVDRNRLDGLIFWASSLSSYVGPEFIQQFCESYHPLPMVCIGMPMPGIPAIVLDSYQGMRSVLLHLVQEHGRRRIAFMRGPNLHYEAELRYKAYVDIVKEYGLDDDPRLVTPPSHWWQPSGTDAARLLVEERQVPFDAIGCVNDALAIGAMRYLQNRGINVPADVSIIGFDNSLDGRFITPPITTVPTRMKERGRMAVRILLAQIAGEHVPEVVTLPSTVLCRQSCGCPDPQVVEAGRAEDEFDASGPIEEIFSDASQGAAQHQAVLLEMEHALVLEEAPPGWADTLLDAFVSDVANTGAGSGNTGSNIADVRGGRSSNTFLATLKRLLHASAPAGVDMITWQRVISTMRWQTFSLLRPDPKQLDYAERLLHQARVMISETSLRSQGKLDLERDRQLNHLLRIRQDVSGAQGMQEMVEILAKELPNLGIQRCFLALYENPQVPVQGVRYVLVYDETRRYTELEGSLVSPSWDLRPLDVPANVSQSLVVYPLYYRDEQLGFVLLDVCIFQGTVHQILCEQLSSALKSVLLVEQNSQLYRQALEAQHLAEEANLLKSRFLSMVSHELLTPMVLLVGLSEMMLREGIGNRPPLPEAYHQDLTRIHAGAQQLGSLVRDVLDLARGQLGQLKLAKRPVNLDEVFKPVALVGEQMAHSKGLAWRVEVPPHLPQIMGDTARLQQVALNLVTNAVKFTACGEVKLVVEVDEDEVTVSIQDTGLGVPDAEQAAIFDEFRQSERTVARGYGGLGIGLAICRQLIDLHGGKIGVRSGGAENSGSSFYFVLPVLKTERAAPPDSPSQTVLVLTSHIERAARLKEHLVQAGYKAETLGIDENPNWLGTVMAAPPGAIVLDIPVAERGWELMELLRNNPDTQDIPVIFYSFWQEKSSGAMLSLEYLLKPVADSELSKALDRYGLSGSGADGPSCVLIVDDDVDILDVHTRMVAEHIPDCQILRATNGRIALDLMRHTVPMLVLLDLMMPELDGIGVLRAMQEDERLREIPVIVLTAQSLNEDEMKHMNRGVVSVLSKGVYTMEETLAHIDQALARSKRVGSDAQRLVRKVMAYIHEHYPEPISRDQLSNYAGVSDRHLNRCFLQETGLSPVSYLNRYRIQKAKCMLKDGCSSITEVMEAVGFSDSSHFSHIFRRETGISPREYARAKDSRGKDPREKKE
jgi:signal transduction histidine kinase/DNA-binding LacI/PurR family transcriptional regulator/AraC-like DNA-binding protein